MPKARGKAQAEPSPDGAGTRPRAFELPPDLPFERALERLERVVDQLDDGELDLEAALAAFEEGVALSKHCASQLERAERRIEILVEEGGELLARPFEDEDEDSSEDDAL